MVYTLIILVETNLHASCPESGVVVVGSMVSYLVESSMVIFVGGGGGGGEACVCIHPLTPSHNTHSPQVE